MEAALFEYHKEEDPLDIEDFQAKLAGVHLPVEEMAMTTTAQIHKLEVVLEELDKRLGLQDSSRIKWNVKLIHNKDLLATIHLLVAMVRCFQPELDLPLNVKVEVILVETNKSGIKSEVQTEVLTEKRDVGSDSLSNTEKEDPIEQLLKLETHKVNTVKKAILHFVNQNMSTMGLQVADMDKQFADGVILLLLIGQLEGFFIPLHDFNLTPVSPSEMLHNVTLALDLLTDTGLQVSNVDPQGRRCHLEDPVRSIQEAQREMRHDPQPEIQTEIKADVFVDIQETNLFVSTKVMENTLTLRFISSDISKTLHKVCLAVRWKT
ncbi:Gamma-parvin [Larimichthys crocea]|uniref:Uncharacterized protein n=1 Tax=Larimichthys crocea TaxID=215358 RepID=A0ACD3QH98_LARCR|nr:Gamma-parvin [Larimichthys crocea]